jgi:hypothetical protein
MIDDGVISPQERAAYLVNGELTAEGKTRISRLMLGRFFLDPAQMERTPAVIQNKLERVAASLASIEGHKGWNLSPTVQEALNLIEQAGKQGRTDLRLYLKQQGLFGTQEYSEDVIKMAENLLSRGLNDFGKAVRQYAEDANFAGKGKAMFGPEITPGSAFADAFGKYKPK